MELYETLAAWTGWPAVVALMLLAGGFAGGFGYWMFQQRTATLKERIEYLENQNSDLKEQRPDVLAETQARRIEILTEELGRLHQDEEKNRELIAEKEGQLRNAIAEMRDLQEELDKAQSVISKYDSVINDYHLTQFIYGIQDISELISDAILKIIESRKEDPAQLWANNYTHELVSELAEKSTDLRTSARVLSLINSEASKYAQIYLEKIETTIMNFLKGLLYNPTEAKEFPELEQLTELEATISYIREGLLSLSREKENRQNDVP